MKENCNLPQSKQKFDLIKKIKNTTKTAQANTPNPTLGGKKKTKNKKQPVTNTLGFLAMRHIRKAYFRQRGQEFLPAWLKLGSFLEVPNKVFAVCSDSELISVIPYSRY